MTEDREKDQLKPQPDYTDPAFDWKEAVREAGREAEKEYLKKHSFIKGFASGAAVAAAALLVVFLVIPNILRGSAQAVLNTETESKIEALAALIQDNYYEDVDVEELQEGLYRGLFDNLDVYSCYYTEEEYQSLYEDTLTGTYCGIGASLQQSEETMQVSIVHVYDESPAQEAGLQEGDIIYSADDHIATEVELSEFVQYIRGEENTSVHLVVYRDGKELEFDITRKSLSLPTVSSDMLDDHIGYIAVSEFTGNTTEQFTAALEELEAEGMEALIIDLRSNPGGMLTTVCDMVDEILPEGLIVYTQDRNSNKEEYYSTDEKSLDIPLAVLVNENSASASEIFAGAIQDREAGTIIGTTTYGKGVVQVIQELNDGSALKLTTHKYYTPNGTCIQGIGITPDVEIEYEFLGGEEDSYRYDLDNQIQKAVEVLQTEK